MKRAIQALGALALMAGFFIAAPPAYADYNGTCGNLTSWDGQGNVSINDQNACTLPINVTSSGSVSITAPSISGSGKNISGTVVTVTANSGDIEVGTVTSTVYNTILSGENVKTSTISSNWGVRVTATDGTLDLENITSNANNGSFGGNVILTATGNIKTGNITNGGTTTAGGIEIHANTAGGESISAFNIGGGGSNGTGVLDVRNTTGGGSDPGYMPAGIYVTNGNSSSTAGITVDSMSSLKLTSSGGRAGLLILDAKDGTLTLPSGSLSAAGTSNKGAGSIFLLAKTLTTANGTIITASQDSSASGTYHYVDIAATTISVTGASGLEVKADGNGVSQATASAGLMPKGSISVSSNDSLNGLFWTVGVSAYTTDGPVTVSGSGKIKLSANGDYSRASVSGNGITFSNSGDVTIEAKGDTSHEVTIAYSGSLAGTDLTFSGSGDVILDASAAESGDDGGDVNIYTHKFAMNKASIEFKANGPTSGTGNGGIIYVSTSWDSGAGFQLNASSTAKFSANAASSGTGNATYADPDSGSPKAITLWAGDVTLKLGTTTGSGQISFSAKGGSAGGNGGAVVTTGSGMQLKTADAVDVSALAGDGNGGSFQWFTTISSIESGITNPVIKAKGHGTGIGGKIKGYHSISQLDVQKYVNVDGGSSVLSTSEGDYGRITLNDVTCQRRATNVSDFPVYANCVTTGASSDLDKAPASIANSALATRTGTNTRIHLSVFDSRADYQYYYQVFTNPAPGSGETWPAIGTTPNIYSSVWEKNPQDGNPFSENTLKETTLHEVGHAFDHLIGQSDQSGSDDYDDYAQRDFADLDYAVIGADAGSSTPRPPCQAYGATPAPFLNVIDHAPAGQGGPQYICHASGDPSTPGTTLNSRYSGMTNHQILQHTNVGEYWFTKHTNLWNELYAQGLAFEGFAGPNNHQGYNVPDNVFKNGRFSCTRNWANRVMNGYDTPSAGCTRVDWYTF